VGGGIGAASDAHKRERADSYDDGYDRGYDEGRRSTRSSYRYHD
jgi:hypothetical protein